MVWVIIGLVILIGCMVLSEKSPPPVPVGEENQNYKFIDGSLWLSEDYYTHD